MSLSHVSRQVDYPNNHLYKWSTIKFSKKEAVDMERLGEELIMFYALLYVHGTRCRRGARWRRLPCLYYL